ncbi:ABC transporter permease, partial [Enterobacter cloacae subsp. cloacae]
MSGVMVLANSVVVLILIFVLWCVLFRSRDVKFAFLNLFRHKRRSYST